MTTATTAAHPTPASRESAFTPGPWRVNKYGGIGAGVHGVTPVILNATSWDHDWDDESRKRQSADCALIAAAPALYEALEECCKRLRACAKLCGNDDWAIDALCEQFETPLALARGEAK